MPFLFAVACLTLFLIVLYTSRPSDLPPGPWNLPIMGSLLRLNAEAPYISLTNLSQNYGPIYGLKLGKLYTVVVADAILLKKILLRSESTGRTPLYILDTVVKDRGILFTQGDLWKDQRKFVTNFLNEEGVSKNSAHRERKQQEIMKSVDDFIQYIQHQGDRVVINCPKAFVHNVASVSTILFFGKFWQRNDKNWNHLLNLLDEASSLMGVAGPLNFLPFLRFMPKYTKLLSFISEVYDAIHKTNRDIVDKVKLDKSTSSSLIHAFQKKRLEQKNKAFYSEEQLCCLLVDIFAASIDTTVHSLAWIILYLAKYTEVQEKMRLELYEVLKTQTLKIDDLRKLPFTESTITEVARIRTIVPLGLPHCALKDINIDKIRIPAGAMIMPLLWGIHMDPKVWSDPGKFRPERFLDNEDKFYKPESFIPFQTGRRKCIGEELAKMVLFLFTVTIVRNFKIESEENKEIDLNGVCGLLLKPKSQNVVFIKI